MRTTTFSVDRRYRYTLWREWEKDVCADPGLDRLVTLPPVPYVQFVGLNPSTADETTDDQTIRRCVQFAKDWGYGALCMTNLFAWRDTSPERMKLVADPVGPDNDFHLKHVAAEAALVVCCWGNHGRHLSRGLKVKWLLGSDRLHCLRVTGKGQPEHPSRLPGDLRPVPYL